MRDSAQHILKNVVLLIMLGTPRIKMSRAQRRKNGFVQIQHVHVNSDVGEMKLSLKPRQHG